MRWRGRRQSDQVEDRRGGGGPRRPATIGGGIAVIVIALIVMAMGGDPKAVLQLLDPGAQQPQVQQPNSPQDEELKAFISTVLADTEDVWGDLFQEQLGGRYQRPKLVLFSGRVQSACGSATSAVGPFYCPADRTIYIDLSFYRELREKYGAPGDFAQAYVLAHEVGHHVQNLLGISNEVHSRQRTLSKVDANELSVRQELQADFFAGVWAHHAHRTKNILEKGDVEEAMRCAAAIGDDRLQQQGRGYVVPESFTHGTSKQRMRWFLKGLETGDLNQGNTFEAQSL